MTLTDTRTGNYTHRSTVDSSNLREVLYDSETSTLYVTFHSGGVAGYRDVPYAEYERLLEADAAPNGSVGRTYNQIFRQKRWGSKPQYAGTSVPTEFVFRAPVVAEVQDVTKSENVTPLAPWETALLMDEDVEPLDSEGVKEEAPELDSEFLVTLSFMAGSVPDIVRYFENLDLGEAIVSISKV